MRNAAATFDRQKTMTRPSGLRGFIVGLIMAVMLVISMPNISTALAQSPDDMTPSMKNSGVLGATNPVTGAATSPGILVPPTPANGSSSGIDGGPEMPEEEVSKTKSYTRFEVHQQARKPLAGNLLVKGDGFEQTVPYSVSANEQFTVSAMFPDLTGRYELNMTAVGWDQNILSVEGDLQKVSEGKYSHQFITGDADPALLVLAPDDVGMAIALGSVKASLVSCIQLFSPSNAVLHLGVDIDGDGVIKPSESISQAIQDSSDACVSTPESNIPLTSLYEAQVVSEQGTVLAQNKGLYDFLNKSSIESQKHARSEHVREFKVQWARIPVATSIEVLNSSIRPPVVQVSVKAQAEEVTGDIILNDSGGSGGNPNQGGDLPKSPVDSGPVETNNPFGFLVDNLLWISLILGVSAVGFVFFHGVPTRPVSYQEQ